MSSDIKPGDEVVCVSVTPLRTTPRDRYPALGLIKVGKVYVVEATRINPVHGTLGIRLVGIDSGKDKWYHHCRFRKVQKKFKGMEVLNGLLLNPTKELEHAD